MELEMELLEERYGLAIERIAQIAAEGFPGGEKYGDVDAFFRKTADFLLLVDDNRKFVSGGGLRTASLKELGERNHALYRDILPGNYEHSYANPAFSVKLFGEKTGRLFAFLHRELLSVIAFCYREKLEELVIRMELFVEIYGAYAERWQEEEKLAEDETLQKILYWFLSDYADIAAQNQVEQMVKPGASYTVKLLREKEFTDPRDLYAYGEYIGENELELAAFMQGLPQETVDLMADTYTEGYRIGFEVTGIDLSKKKTAELLYPIGMERMMQKAMANLEKIGLKAVGRDQSASALYCGNPAEASGSACSVHPNRQFGFDHKDDIALFIDKALVERRLEVMQTAFEENKADAALHAGPAVVVTFGEKDYDPVNKPENVHMSEELNELCLNLRMRRRQIQTNYIPQDERSFTIIAFPIPEIRNALPENTPEMYSRFFEEVIRINTLDYRLYRDIQATIIETLNQADHCEIRGMNGNQTDLSVNLYKLSDPEKEVIFENCVADVNIPVGEVFTSPVLKGTNGLLHVSRVFLNGLEYKNLSIRFEDGMIAEYNCDNFETKQENLDFIRENILFRHKTLPLGEFAIGTNTTAYVVARKYGVQAKLPILIAEKTGPHFAVGDTCYSRSEDVKVYNPDGREIVAKDNEVSILRKTDPSKAYMECHTDITIPYDELGELAAVKKDGSRIVIIRDGRFVLPGTEELNRPLDKEKNLKKV